MLPSQNKNLFRGLILAVTSLATVIPCCQSAYAQQASPTEFRIETDLMEPGKGKPIDQSIALFGPGVSYEFSRETPHKITVINSIENRVIFLDTQRQVQSRVNLQELKAYIDTARNQFTQSPRGAEALKDATITEFDAASNTVSAGKQLIRYEAKIEQPDNPQVSDVYASFANNSAILNAWQSKGAAPPPFARLQLNQAVREKAAIPSEIKRTILTGGKAESLSSRIHITYTLAASERKQIEQFNEMISSFASVALAVFNAPNQKINR
jgi:hypothetical protein